MTKSHGTKRDMSQIFSDDGTVEPVTFVQVARDADFSLFKEGDKVKVSGISKGKGFQGVVKRHGFHGASQTHGTKHAHRQPGSIGSTWPQRVLKGKRMAGHMGSVRVTQKNVKVVRVIPEERLIALKGAVPGARGGAVEIISLSP